MEEVDVRSLKETLYDQFLIIQKLNAELDEEREASATAASEALSMILRLQGEKAAEKMESCQYKRMAEEKIHHAEESLVVLEDLLYQKEMEIASLRFEVQEYEWKLADSFCDARVREVKELEKQSSKHESSSNGFMRRNVSLPILQIKELRSKMDREMAYARSAFSSPRCTSESVNKLNQMTAQECAAGIQSRLSKLSVRSTNEEVTRPIGSLHDTNVEEVSVSENKLSDDKAFGPYRAKSTEFMSSRERCETYLRHSTRSDRQYGLISREIEKEVKNVSSSFIHTEDREPSEFNASISSRFKSVAGEGTTKSVLDIFEIPQTYGAQGERQKLPSLRSIAEDNDKLDGFSELAPQNSLDCLKYDEWLKKERLNSYYGSKLLTPRKELVAPGNWPDETPKSSTSSSWIDVEQLEKRLQMLEEDRIAMQHENSTRDEQLKLLRDIHEQLKLMQCHESGRKSRRTDTQIKSSLDSLMEAMLSFSI